MGVLRPDILRREYFQTLPIHAMLYMLSAAGRPFFGKCQEQARARAGCWDVYARRVWSPMVGFLMCVCAGLLLGFSVLFNVIGCYWHAVV